jgi:hypothetical protein
MQKAMKMIAARPIFYHIKAVNKVKDQCPRDKGMMLILLIVLLLPNSALDNFPCNGKFVNKI